MNRAGCYRWISTMVLVAGLALPLTARAATEELTKAERKIGRDSISEFKANLAKADDEDRKLYGLLTKNKGFFRIWSRALADRKSPKKMKALIRACRKQKLWANVDWMLDELKKIDASKPSYYRLKALARYEAGNPRKAMSVANGGLMKFPFHRGLRRIFSKLQREIDYELSSRPLIANLKELEFVVDHQLCRERAHFLARSLDFALCCSDLPKTMTTRGPHNDVQKFVGLWQKDQEDKHKLPSSFNVNHKCQYLALFERPRDGLQSLACTTHGEVFMNSSKNREYRLIKYRVKPQVILDGMKMKDNDCAQKAAEYLLRSCKRLSENEEKLIGDIVKRENLTKIQCQKLLSCIVWYLRHYDIGNELKKTLYARCAKARGYSRGAYVLIKAWCGDYPTKLDEEETLALVNSEQPLYLFTLEKHAQGINRDRQKIILDCYTPLGMNGLKKLDEMLVRNKVYSGDVGSELRRTIERMD